jgi:DNA adenine methylase
MLERVQWDHYPGSKGADGVWQRIISEMPPHRVYIEAFLGSGVILRKKLPSTITIGIDADPAVCRIWQSCSNAKDGEAAGSPGCTVICGEARRVLRDYAWSGGELVYCDPPYLLSTRSNQRPLYDYEFSKEDEHEDLLISLKHLPCMVMISGYWSELYGRILAGWRTVQIPTVKRNGEPAVEWLWCNFPEPVQLHDYRFVGQGYRERERIKKKMRRWTAKLRAMPALERSALFWAMSQLRPSPPDLVSGAGAPHRI